MRRGTTCLIAVTLLGAGPAQARPFKYAYKSKYGHVDFSWSTEASAVPALVKRLRAELAKQKADTVNGGKMEFEVHPVGWASSTKIITSGQTPRLLSLSRVYWAFTGGAHGNGRTTGLLWDRKAGKEIRFASLFSEDDGYAKPLRGAYCKALDREREKRRGPDYRPGGGDPRLAATFSEFDRCPKFSDIALIPGDSNHNGRFDRVHLIAAPYTAGSFAEGEYDIILPVTRPLAAALKPEYRSSFEVQRQ